MRKKNEIFTFTKNLNIISTWQNHLGHFLQGVNRRGVFLEYFILFVCFWRLWERASLEQRCKQPTRCNNFRLFIYWSVWIWSTYFGQQTRSFSVVLLTVYSFGTMHQYCCRQVTRLRWKWSVPSHPCHRSAPISVHFTKVLLKMGEFFARNT